MANEVLRAELQDILLMVDEPISVRQITSAIFQRMNEHESRIITIRRPKEHTLWQRIYRMIDACPDEFRFELPPNGHEIEYGYRPPKLVSFTERGKEKAIEEIRELDQARAQLTHDETFDGVNPKKRKYKVTPPPRRKPHKSSVPAKKAY